MNKRCDKPLSPEELAALPDEAVDTSDIPALDAAFWKNASVMMPGGGKRQLTLRLDQDVRAVLDEMQEIVEGLAQASITDEEVERIKTRRLKYIKLAMTNSGRIGVQLSEFAAMGDWRLFFLNRDRLKEVTTADVQRVAETYLVESNRTAGLFIPDQDSVRAEIPPRPDVAALVAGYEGTETIHQLVVRVRAGDVKEVIMATNPNMAGDGTTLYISSLLRTTGVKITRLARGLPTGSSIEYASGKMLADAIVGRQELE